MKPEQTPDTTWSMEFRRPHCRTGFGGSTGPSPYPHFFTPIDAEAAVVGHIISLNFRWFYIVAWRHQIPSGAMWES